MGKRWGDMAAYDAGLESSGRLLFEKNPLPMLVYDIETLRFLDVNEALLASYGYSREEFLRMHLPDIRPPQDIPRLVETVRAANKPTRAWGRWQHRWRNGEIRDVEVHSQAYDFQGHASRLVAIRDVTDELGALKRERERTVQLEYATWLGRLGGWRYDLATAELHPSVEALLIHGRSPHERPSPEDLIAQYPPGDRQRLFDRWTALVTDGTRFDEEFRFNPIGRATIWVRVIGEAVRSDSGAIDRVHGAIQDIDERKRLAETSLALAQRLNATLEGLSDGFVVVDRDWRLTFINREAEHIAGIPREMMLGLDVRAFFSRDRLPRPFEHYEKALADNRSVAFEYHVAEKDQWLYVSAAPGPDGLAIHFRDITEQKKLEANLLRTQRLESLGALAGGIAHDMSNVLQPIVSLTALMREGETDPARLSDLETIQICAQHGADLVKRLLAFSHGTGGASQPVRLVPLLRETQFLLQETLPADIHCELELDADESLAVFGNETLVRQVLLNLAINARDAMPTGGTLTLAAHVSGDCGPGCVTPAEREKRLVVLGAARETEHRPAPPLARLSVTDTGVGMTAEVRTQMFEPFFTTKGPDHGTGLGLPTVLTIVRGMGGCIDVETAPGAGTRIDVFIPLAVFVGEHAVTTAEGAPLHQRAA
jgi:two-component system, cell cycle sensor histidine kinase and response regulator CckA